MLGGPAKPSFGRRPFAVIGYAIAFVGGTMLLLWDSLSVTGKLLVVAVPLLLVGVYVWSRTPTVPKRP